MKRIGTIESLAFCSLALATSSGCAFGNKLEYRGTPDIAEGYKVEAPVLLGVVDRRADAADKGDNWVGVQRSLAGIPYRVVTASGRPLATDVGEALTASLVKDGFAARQVLVPTGAGDRVAEGLVKPVEGRGILLVIRKWATDLYLKMTVTYDLGIEVIDSAGKLLAEASFAGEDVIDQSNVKKPKRMSASATIASLFGDLLKANNVRGALLGETLAVPSSAPATAPAAVPTMPTPPARTSAQAPPPNPVQPLSPASKPGTAQPAQAQKCSVEQVMKMKDLKFSDAQIKAACE